MPYTQFPPKQEIVNKNNYFFYYCNVFYDIKKTFHARWYQKIPEILASIFGIMKIAEEILKFFYFYYSKFGFEKYLINKLVLINDDKDKEKDEFKKIKSLKNENYEESNKYKNGRNIVLPNGDNSIKRKSKFSNQQEDEINSMGLFKMTKRNQNVKRKQKFFNSKENKNYNNAYNSSDLMNVNNENYNLNSKIKSKIFDTKNNEINPNNENDNENLNINKFLIFNINNNKNNNNNNNNNNMIKEEEKEFQIVSENNENVGDNNNTIRKQTINKSNKISDSKENENSIIGNSSMDFMKINIDKSNNIDSSRNKSKFQENIDNENDSLGKNKFLKNNDDKKIEVENENENKENENINDNESLDKNDENKIENEDLDRIENMEEKLSIIEKITSKFTKIYNYFNFGFFKFILNKRKRENIKINNFEFFANKFNEKLDIFHYFKIDRKCEILQELQLNSNQSHLFSILLEKNFTNKGNLLAQSNEIINRNKRAKEYLLECEIKKYNDIDEKLIDMFYKQL